MLIMDAPTHPHLNKVTLRDPTANAVGHGVLRSPSVATHLWNGLQKEERQIMLTLSLRCQTS